AEHPAWEVARRFDSMMPLVAELGLAAAVALGAVRRWLGHRGVLAVGALAWLGVVAVMTEAGFSGNARYLIAPVALPCLAGGGAPHRLPRRAPAAADPRRAAPRRPRAALPHRDPHAGVAGAFHLHLTRAALPSPPDGHRRPAPTGGAGAVDRRCSRPRVRRPRRPRRALARAPHGPDARALLDRRGAVGRHQPARDRRHPGRPAARRLAPAVLLAAALVDGGLRALGGPDPRVLAALRDAHDPRRVVGGPQPLRRAGRVGPRRAD